MGGSRKEDNEDAAKKLKKLRGVVKKKSSDSSASIARSSGEDSTVITPRTPVSPSEEKLSDLTKFNQYRSALNALENLRNENQKIKFSNIFNIFNNYKITDEMKSELEKMSMEQRGNIKLLIKLASDQAFNQFLTKNGIKIVGEKGKKCLVALDIAIQQIEQKLENANQAQASAETKIEEKKEESYMGDREYKIDEEIDYDEVVDLTDDEGNITAAGEKFFGIEMSEEDLEANKKFHENAELVIKIVNDELAVTPDGNEKTTAETALNTFNECVAELRKKPNPTYKENEEMRSKFDRAYHELREAEAKLHVRSFEEKENLPDLLDRAKEKAEVQKIVKDAERELKPVARFIELMQKRLDSLGSSATEAERAWLKNFREYVAGIENNLAAVNRQMNSSPSNLKSLVENELNSFGSIKAQVSSFTATNPLTDKLMKLFEPQLKELQQTNPEKHEQVQTDMLQIIKDSRDVTFEGLRNKLADKFFPEARLNEEKIVESVAIIPEVKDEKVDVQPLTRDMVNKVVIPAERVINLITRVLPFASEYYAIDRVGCNKFQNDLISIQESMRALILWYRDPDEFKKSYDVSNADAFSDAYAKNKALEAENTIENLYQITKSIQQELLRQYADIHTPEIEKIKADISALEQAAPKNLMEKAIFISEFINGDFKRELENTVRIQEAEDNILKLKGFIEVENRKNPDEGLSGAIREIEAIQVDIKDPAKIGQLDAQLNRVAEIFEEQARLKGERDEAKAAAEEKKLESKAKPHFDAQKSKNWDKVIKQAPEQKDAVKLSSANIFSPAEEKSRAEIQLKRQEGKKNLVKPEEPAPQDETPRRGPNRFRN